MQCRSLRAAAAVAAPAPAQYVGVPTGTHPSLARGRLLTRGVPTRLTRARRQDYRLFLKSGDNVVSAWHDVPLYSSTAGALNFVCEIPKETKAKARLSPRRAASRARRQR